MLVFIIGSNNNIIIMTNCMEQIPSTNVLHADLLKNCDITSITFTVAFSLLPYTVVGRGGGGDLEQGKIATYAMVGSRRNCNIA